MRIAGLGGWEWIIILIIVVILFGGSRLAGVGKALGQSIREFRDGISSGTEEKKKEDKPDDASDESKSNNE